MKDTHGWPDPFKGARDHWTRDYFDRALKECKGSVTMVAHHAGVHPSLVYHYMAKHGLKTEHYHDGLRHALERSRAYARLEAEQRREERRRGR